MTTYQSYYRRLLEIKNPYDRICQLECLRRTLWEDYHDDEARAILRGHGCDAIGHKLSEAWEQLRLVRFKAGESTTYQKPLVSAREERPYGYTRFR